MSERTATNIAWLALGWLSIGLGAAGIVLPLVPTTPFLLVAAFAFSKGSERWHRWLINHPTFGPPIVRWQTERTISRGAKWLGTLSLAVVFGVSLALDVPQLMLAIQGAVLVFVCGFLWTRAE